MDPSESLKEFITIKSEALKKYFHGQITVTWNLAMEKQMRIAHCHLVGQHMDYFGHSDTEDFKASIDNALDKIEKQIRRHKEIVTHHHHKNSEPSWEPAALPAET
jgi:putative sigma-54 modulation protein